MLITALEKERLNKALSKAMLLCKPPSNSY